MSNQMYSLLYDVLEFILFFPLSVSGYIFRINTKLSCYRQEFARTFSAIICSNLINHFARYVCFTPPLFPFLVVWGETQGDSNHRI